VAFRFRRYPDAGLRVTRHCFHQNCVSGTALQVAGPPYSEELVGPAIDLLVIGALHHLAPEPSIPQRPLVLFVGSTPSLT